MNGEQARSAAALEVPAAHDAGLVGGIERAAARAEAQLAYLGALEGGRVEDPEHLPAALRDQRGDPARLAALGKSPTEEERLAVAAVADVEGLDRAVRD